MGIITIAETRAQRKGRRSIAKQSVSSGTLKFEVDSGLLFQLGEQLVARRSVALAELVKNAYDADATRVTVLLENVLRSGGTIIVEDDGNGMTFEDIKNHWMRIATDDKLENPTSPLYGRPRTGAKGIGRLAVRRLSSKLTLYSVACRSDGSKERIVVEFDWQDSFKPGQLLTNVPVTYQRTVVNEETPNGVTLHLENIRDAWTREDLVQLRRDLMSLVIPLPKDFLGVTRVQRGKKRDPGFSMKLEIPDFPELAGELGEEFLSAAWGVLTGRVDRRGTPHYNLTIRTPNEQRDFVPKEERLDTLADVKIRIHYFVYKSDYFDGFDFGIREAQQLGREQGGVRIYLNGFRVFPYGDPGDDWLMLNEIRAGRTQRPIAVPQSLAELEDEVPGRPLLLLPGNNQLFGVVAISQTDQPDAGRPTIELNVSRERLLENEAYQQLLRFIQVGIYWMTIEYARVTAPERARKKKTEAPKVAEIVEQARSQVLASTELSRESKRTISQLLDYAKERAEAEEAEHISEVSMLRVMSSAAATVILLNHQLRAVVDGIRAIQTDLRELGEGIPNRIREEYDSIVERIGDWRTMVTRQVSQLGFLLAPESRLRRRRPALRKVVEDVTNQFSLYMRDFGIKFDNGVPANLRTPPIFEAELHAVLLHIFTNALKAVRDREVSRIAVMAAQQSDGLHILMLDTGVGIEPERREKVFEAFETTSTPDLILGVGTGLGLKVVRDILEMYGGTARFIDPEAPWSTCIEIFLPKET